jgi:hypothetical protein
MAAASAATATAVARPVLFLEDGDDEAEAHTDNAPGYDTTDGRASVNEEAVEQQHQHQHGFIADMEDVCEPLPGMASLIAPRLPSSG